MLGKLFLFGILGAGAYIGARRLIDDPAFIDELPEPAREPVHELRERLVDLDALVRDVLAEVSSERRRAEQQLHEEYVNRVRRQDREDTERSPFEAAPQPD